MHRNKSHPLGTYGNSNEFIAIVNDFSNLALSSEEERSYTGRLKKETILRFGDGALDTIDYEDILFILSPDEYRKECDLANVCSESYGQYLYFKLGSHIKQFTIHFCKEIRECICNDDKQEKIYKNSDVSISASITALSVWVTKELGLEEPIAVGLVTSVLIIVATATKGAFCKMTEKEVEEALNEKYDKSK